MKKWFTANGLVINSKKTQIIPFHSNYSNTIHSDSSYLDEFGLSSNSTKFLGIRIDSRLTWREHIATLAQSLSRAYYMINTLSRAVDLDTLKLVYYGYVYSRLTFGIIFWGDSVDCSTIFRIQKKIVRAIVKKNHFKTPCIPIFKTLNILPLACIYIFKILIYMKNNPTLFENLNNSQIYNTRTNDLFYPIHRTAQFEQTPLYAAVRVFNKLPAHIKTVVCFRDFKRKLLGYLRENCFYTINEYLNS